MGQKTAREGPKKEAPGIWKVHRGRRRIRVRGRNPSTGKLREIDRTVACTAREAKRLREQWYTELIAGVEGDEPPPRETLRTYATSWLAGRRGRVRWSVLQLYASYLELHILPAIGDLYLDALTRWDIEGWVAAQAEGAAPRSVNARLGLLRAILREAAAELDLRDPSALVRPLRVPRDTGSAMTPEQLARLLGVVRRRAPEDYPLALVLATTGMRWGEATALQWSDIDRDRKVIHLQRSQRNRRVDDTKTARPRRIPMPDALAEALDDHRRWQIEHQCPGLQEGWLFVDGAHPDGRPRLWWTGAWKDRLEAWCREAGIPRMTAHSFRRSYVDLLRLSGADAMVEHAIVGHADERMRELYSTVQPQETRDLVERAARLIFGGESVGD